MSCDCICHGVGGEIMADHFIPCCSPCRSCGDNIVGDITEHEKICSCRHLQVTPDFDEDEVYGLDAYEIRKKYPRFEGVCPDCGQQVIVYASAAQYILGDY